MSRSAPVLALLLALLLTACGSADSSSEQAAPTSPSATASEAGTEPGTEPGGHGDGGHGDHAEQAADDRPPRPLRAGERRLGLEMPADYTPSAPYGRGTDDYRCFLLDPRLDADQVITGFDVRPGNPEVVHHVILFRVPTEQVAEAERVDAGSDEQGWTCFGDTGLGGGPGAGLDDAPWLGAWAPGGREQVHPRGLGVELGRGSRLVMQVHYNLVGGTSPDRSAVDLRLAPRTPRTTLLHTQLLPAPVELPCRPGRDDAALCQRATAVADVKERFGDGPGATADLLHLLCGEIRPGAVQTCDRPVTTPQTVRGVAGHMHLLGREIRIEVNPGTPRARTLLDVPVWDFDDQGSRAVRPTRLEPGDTVRVTCRHTQALRDRLPAFDGVPERYVVWGEGSTDEMCLGILQVTRP